MTTVTRGTGPHQSRGTNGTENALIGGLLLVTTLSIGALVYVVRISGDMGTVAPVAVTTIGGIALAAISALTVVLRRRPPRGRR
ncbi:hypothetical protein GCM10023176_49370 [Micromonospora coerulea]|uniref:DUF3188 domain-containing protein n=1 Tax=Micromonospora coerulea TaxID=47856 RepID=A0ABP8SZ38_9ACTN